MLPVRVLLGGLLIASGSALHLRYPRSVASRRGAIVALIAAPSADESTLLEAIRSTPEDKRAVLAECVTLGAQPGLEALEGDWCVEWTDLGKGFGQKLCATARRTSTSSAALLRLSQLLAA